MSEETLGQLVDSQAAIETLAAPPPPLPPPPTWAMLKLDICRSPFTGARRLVDKAVLAVLKLFRVHLMTSGDMPTVLSLAPFEAAPSALRPEQLSPSQENLGQLGALGFVEPVYHLIRNPLASCDTVLTTLRHTSGKAIARVTCHFHRLRKQPVVFVEYFSELANGDVLLTWPRGMEVLSPPGWHCVSEQKQTTSQLWATHCARFSQPSTTRHVVAITSTEAMREMFERHQRTLAEFQLAHKVFVHLNEQDKRRIETVLADQTAAQRMNAAHADVMAEIAKLQSTKSSWKSMLIILVISGLAFVAAGLGKNSWDGQFLAILIGVLFFHETGHYVAMRCSGYRNLKMFFIPFFGAAVSGQSYNVAGWKKVLVSLMGPVPGILLAIPLGIIGTVLGLKVLVTIAFMLLVLNGINLLPILPLDGGWVVHNLLFSRNIYLDVVFRCLATAVALFVGIYDKVFMYVGIAMAIGIPLSFKIASIVAALRKEGFEPISRDDQTIPPDMALPIVERIKTAFPRGMNARVAAQRTINVFEALNARPPGWMASTGFLFLHGAALVAALVFAMVFALVSQGGLQSFAERIERKRLEAQFGEQTRLPHTIHPGSIAVLSTSPHKQIPAVTIVADFTTHTAALSAARSLVYPAQVNCCVLGDSVLVALPEDNTALRERIYTALSGLSKDVFVATGKDRVDISIRGKLPTAAGRNDLGQPLEDFLKTPGSESVVAPWDRTDSRPIQQKQQAQMAQAICRQIVEASYGMYQESRYRDIMEQMASARKRGDRTLVEKLKAQQHAAQSEFFLSSLDKLSIAHPDQAGLIAGARSLVPVLAKAGFRQQLAEKARPFVGTLPAGSVNLFGVEHGGASNFEGTLTIHARLISAVDSAPALVNYLAANGTTDIRYHLLLGFGRGEESDDDDETDEP